MRVFYNNTKDLTVWKRSQGEMGCVRNDGWHMLYVRLHVRTHTQVDTEHLRDSNGHLHDSMLEPSLPKPESYRLHGDVCLLLQARHLQNSTASCYSGFNPERSHGTAGNACHETKPLHSPRLISDLTRCLWCHSFPNLSPWACYTFFQPEYHRWKTRQPSHAHARTNTHIFALSV